MTQPCRPSRENNNRKKGFTLVEISIVLTIVGLLIGGVLASQNLIRSGEIRSTISELQSYQVAVNAFTEKYLALPGDMVRATDYWAAAGGTGTGSACFTIDSRVLSDTRRTCNGNGDRLVGETAGSTAASVWRYGERFRFWQHLSNAGLISGTYSGKTDSTTDQFRLLGGVNMPVNKMDDSAFMPTSIAKVTSGDPVYFDGAAKGTYLEFRRSDATAYPPLQTGEAYQIDLKLDDGLPTRGKVISRKRSDTEYPNCTSGNTITSTYDLSNEEDKLCVLSFFLLE